MPLTVKSIPVGTHTSNRCIVLGPKTSYSLPIDMVAAGLSNFTEMWMAVAFDFEGVAGGEIAAETSSRSTDPTGALWMGLKSTGTALPTTYSQASDWFAGVSSHYPASPLEVALTLTSSRVFYNNYSTNGPRLFVHSSGSAVNAIGTANMTTNFGTISGNPITSPAATMVAIFRYVVVGGSLRVYVNYYAPTTTTNPTTATLETLLNARYADPSGLENYSTSVVDSTSLSSFNTLAPYRSANNCAVFIHNPFTMNNLRVHAIVLKKFS